MSAAKGIPQILNAWLELADELGGECPHLWLVGGAPSEIEIMRQSCNTKNLISHEVEGRVRWWGYLDYAGISTLMLKAYVLVTHSLYEPGGRVMLEALAQGIPVIATPHGFAADLIVDWHNGFLVSHGDEIGLKNRMKHFAMQPLLRHAMGGMAQKTASAALKKWDFINTHLNIYERAVRNGSEPIVRNNERFSLPVLKEPVPRGFGGVYPFEAEVASKADVSAFITSYCGPVEKEPEELFCKSGRSRLWTVQRGERRLVIKHSFSTYQRRAIWDLGYAGPIAKFQHQRMLGETLAAFCRGAAPLLAADMKLGLTLREWLEPAPVNESTLSECADLFAGFYKSPHHSIDLASIQAQLQRNWQKMSDEEVLNELAALEADWRDKELPWNAWDPISLRLNWRWLDLGLRRKWLSLPGQILRETNALINEESEVAAEESHLNIGLCHGDADPAHVRRNENGQMVLIDCEKLHPGYFGHDWADLIFSVLNDVKDDDQAIAILRQAVEIIKHKNLCPAKLLFSWFKWTAIIRVGRAQALMEKEAVEEGLVRLKRVQRAEKAKL
jgi:hypothetical protein